jgi:hypothetical protein
MSEQDNTGESKASAFRSRDAVENQAELSVRLNEILVHAVVMRDQAGRSERGRQLAIVATDLEKIKAFVGYYGL